MQPTAPASGVGGRTSPRPTVKDVARLAGVGTGTVSRVLNADARVGVDSRTRVLAAIASLGYVRDAAARELRRGSSATIGLMVEDVADPFYSQLHRSIEASLERLDLALLTVSSGGSAERVRRRIDGLAARRVEGLIVTLPVDADERGLEALAREGVHVVFVDRPAIAFPADSVLTANRAGARLAIDHLLGRGHVRLLAFLDDASHWTANERLAGVMDAVAAAGLDGDAVTVLQAAPDDDLVAARLREALARPDPPTAVLSGNNRTSVSVLRAFRTVGCQLDHVGFDDVELADLLDPPMTVVAQDPAAIGAIAAEMLLERLAGFDGPPRERLLEPTLIVRGT